MSLASRIRRSFAFLGKYHNLLYELALRDYKRRYRRSYFGCLWSVVTPFCTMMILYMVFSTFFRFRIENYPLYLICGQLLYSFYAEVTGGAMSAIFANGRLLRKVYIPKKILPFASVLTSIASFAYSIPAVFVFAYFMLGTLQPRALLVVIPLGLFFVFCLGVGLLLSALTVKFRDIVHLYRIFLRALMYGTPIFYPVSIVPEKYRFIVDLNPLYHYITLFRDFLYGEAWPSMELCLLCTTLSLVALVAGTAVFNRYQKDFLMNL